LVQTRLVRAVLVTGIAALLFAWPAAGAEWTPSPAWLAQAKCVHLKEGAWTANTGNGYFGGFQFASKTWKRIGGAPDSAFAHPGNSLYPFHATAAEQLFRAWLLWKHDGGSWKSWGAVGASCT
jgi:resuscitation-promoting factor RpfA